MKRFYVAIFVVVALLHFIGTIFLVAQLDSAGWAIERGELNHNMLWLTFTWIWAPVPMLLSRFVHPLSPMHLLTLGLPWSVFVGLCFRFLAPRLSRWRHQTPNPYEGCQGVSLSGRCVVWAVG